MSPAVQIFLYFGIPASALLALIALTVGIFMTYSTNRRYKNAQWIVVPATVRRSRITTLTVDDTTFFTPVIEYSYVYGGKPYHSSVITPDVYYTGAGDKKFAEKWVSILPVGTNTVAYLDRRKPEMAVLFPEHRRGWSDAFLVALAMFGLGILIFGAVLVVVVLLR